jgi:hypothetical protein
MANAVEGSKRQTKRAVIGDRPDSRIWPWEEDADPTARKNAPDWLTRS